MTTSALLINWNRGMALFHGLFVLATIATADFGLRLATYRPVYANNTDGADSDAWVTPSGAEENGQLPIAWIALGFSALSMTFHLLAAVVPAWREWYLRGVLGDARCPPRWLEYSLSAPLQGLAIGWFTGNRFTHELVAIFALTMTTMFFGHLHESLARPKSDTEWAEPNAALRLQAHFLGWVPFLFAVGMIWDTFSTLERDFPNMPDFVRYIVITQLATFTSFGFVQIVVTLRQPRFYYQGEITYMVLSLLAKGALSMLLLANVIAVSTFGNDDESGSGESGSGAY